MEVRQDSKVWHTTVDKSGRVVLPAELRNAIKVSPGTGLVWTKNDGELKLQSLDSLVADIQAHFTSRSPADELWSEEIIRERGEETSRD